MSTSPDRIYLENHLEDHPLSKKILSRLPGIPVTLIDDYKIIGLDKNFKDRAWSARKAELQQDEHFSDLMVRPGK